MRIFSKHVGYTRARVCVRAHAHVCVHTLVHLTRMDATPLVCVRPSIFRIFCGAFGSVLRQADPQWVDTYPDARRDNKQQRGWVRLRHPSRDCGWVVGGTGVVSR